MDTLEYYDYYLHIGLLNITQFQEYNQELISIEASNW